MAETAKFMIGARAACTDGLAGEVSRLILDPETERVTHLVIRPGHRREEERLAPVHLVDTTDGEIRLHCTLEEFGRLDRAGERDQVGGAAGVGTGGLLGEDLVYGGRGPRTYAFGAAGQPVPVDPRPVLRKTVIRDVVPLGQTQVSPGDRVHAADGEIGRVKGFLADPHDDRVTHVLLAEGHLLGHKEVAIPVSAVARVDGGIRLTITREQVRNLPPAS